MSSTQEVMNRVKSDLASVQPSQQSSSALLNAASQRQTRRKSPVSPVVTLDMIEVARNNAPLLVILATQLYYQIAGKPKRQGKPKPPSRYNYYVAQQYDVEHPGYKELMDTHYKERHALIRDRWNEEKETYVIPVGYVFKRDRPVVESMPELEETIPDPPVLVRQNGEVRV